jgi:hypothetical protein
MGDSAGLCNACFCKSDQWLSDCIDRQNWFRGSSRCQFSGGKLREIIVKTKILRGVATAMAALALTFGAVASLDAPATHPAADSAWP